MVNLKPIWKKALAWAMLLTFSVSSFAPTVLAASQSLTAPEPGFLEQTIQEDYSNQMHDIMLWKNLDFWRNTYVVQKLNIDRDEIGWFVFKLLRTQPLRPGATPEKLRVEAIQNGNVIATELLEWVSSTTTPENVRWIFPAGLEIDANAPLELKVSVENSAFSAYSATDKNVNTFPYYVVGSQDLTNWRPMWFDTLSFYDGNELSPTTAVMNLQVLRTNTDNLDLNTGSSYMYPVMKTDKEWLTNFQEYVLWVNWYSYSSYLDSTSNDGVYRSMCASFNGHSNKYRALTNQEAEKIILNSSPASLYNVFKTLDDLGKRAVVKDNGDGTSSVYFRAGSHNYSITWKTNSDFNKFIDGLISDNAKPVQLVNLTGGQQAVALCVLDEMKDLSGLDTKILKIKKNGVYQANGLNINNDPIFTSKTQVVKTYTLDTKVSTFKSTGEHVYAGSTIKVLWNVKVDSNGAKSVNGFINDLWERKGNFIYKIGENGEVKQWWDYNIAETSGELFIGVNDTNTDLTDNDWVITVTVEPVVSTNHLSNKWNLFVNARKNISFLSYKIDKYNTDGTKSEIFKEENSAIERINVYGLDLLGTKKLDQMWGVVAVAWDASNIYTLSETKLAVYKTGINGGTNTESTIYTFDKPLTGVKSMVAYKGDLYVWYSEVGSNDRVSKIVFKWNGKIGLEAVKLAHGQGLLHRDHWDTEDKFASHWGYLLSTDWRYVYNISHLMIDKDIANASSNENKINAFDFGYRIRVYDPSNNWNMVKDTFVPVLYDLDKAGTNNLPNKTNKLSTFTNGFFVDENYIYVLQEKGLGSGDEARVLLIDKNTFQYKNEFTIKQKVDWTCEQDGNSCAISGMWNYMTNEYMLVSPTQNFSKLEFYRPAQNNILNFTLWDNFSVDKNDKLSVSYGYKYNDMLKVNISHRAYDNKETINGWAFTIKKWFEFKNNNIKFLVADKVVDTNWHTLTTGVGGLYRVVRTTWNSAEKRINDKGLNNFKVKVGVVGWELREYSFDTKNWILSHISDNEYYIWWERNEDRIVLWLHYYFDNDNDDYFNVELVARNDTEGSSIAKRYNVVVELWENFVGSVNDSRNSGLYNIGTNEKKYLAVNDTASDDNLMFAITDNSNANNAANSLWYDANNKVISLRANNVDIPLTGDAKIASFAIGSYKDWKTSQAFYDEIKARKLESNKWQGQKVPYVYDANMLPWTTDLTNGYKNSSDIKPVELNVRRWEDEIVSGDSNRPDSFYQNLSNNASIVTSFVRNFDYTNGSIPTTMETYNKWNSYNQLEHMNGRLVPAVSDWWTSDNWWITTKTQHGNNINAGICTLTSWNGWNGKTATLSLTRYFPRETQVSFRLSWQTESNEDKFIFFIGGNTNPLINEGYQYWVHGGDVVKTFTVPKWLQTLRWQYVKDTVNQRNVSDIVCIDDIVINTVLEQPKVQMFNDKTGTKFIVPGFKMRVNELIGANNGSDYDNLNHIDGKVKIIPTENDTVVKIQWYNATTWEAVWGEETIYIDKLWSYQDLSVKEGINYKITSNKAISVLMSNFYEDLAKTGNLSNDTSPAYDSQNGSQFVIYLPGNKQKKGNLFISAYNDQANSDEITVKIEDLSHNKTNFEGHIQTLGQEMNNSNIQPMRTIISESGEGYVNPDKWETTEGQPVLFDVLGNDRNKYLTVKSITAGWWMVPQNAEVFSMNEDWTVDFYRNETSQWNKWEYGDNDVFDTTAIIEINPAPNKEQPCYIKLDWKVACLFWWEKMKINVNKNDLQNSLSHYLDFNYSRLNWLIQGDFNSKITKSTYKNKISYYFRTYYNRWEDIRSGQYTNFMRWKTHFNRYLEVEVPWVENAVKLLWRYILTSDGKLYVHNDNNSVTLIDENVTDVAKSFDMNNNIESNIMLFWYHNHSDSGPYYALDKDALSKRAIDFNELPSNSLEEKTWIWGQYVAYGLGIKSDDYRTLCDNIKAKNNGLGCSGIVKNYKWPKNILLNDDINKYLPNNNLDVFVKNLLPWSWRNEHWYWKNDYKMLKKFEDLNTRRFYWPKNNFYYIKDWKIYNIDKTNIHFSPKKNAVEIFNQSRWQSLFFYKSDDNKVNVIWPDYKINKDDYALINAGRYNSLYEYGRFQGYWHPITWLVALETSLNEVELPFDNIKKVFSVYAWKTNDYWTHDEYKVFALLENWELYEYQNHLLWISTTYLKQREFYVKKDDNVVDMNSDFYIKNNWSIVNLVDRNHAHSMDYNRGSTYYYFVKWGYFINWAEEISEEVEDYERPLFVVRWRDWSIYQLWQVTNTKGWIYSWYYDRWWMWNANRYWLMDGACEFRKHINGGYDLHDNMLFSYGSSDKYCLLDWSWFDNVNRNNYVEYGAYSNYVWGNHHTIPYWYKEPAKRKNAKAKKLSGWYIQNEILSFTQWENGVVDLYDWKLRYTPNFGFSGTDVFTYTTGLGTTTVTVTVKPFRTSNFLQYPNIGEGQILRITAFKKWSNHENDPRPVTIYYGQWDSPAISEMLSANSKSYKYPVWTNSFTDHITHTYSYYNNNNLSVSNWEGKLLVNGKKNAWEWYTATHTSYLDEDKWNKVTSSGPSAVVAGNKSTSQDYAYPVKSDDKIYGIGNSYTVSTPLENAKLVLVNDDVVIPNNLSNAQRDAYGSLQLKFTNLKTWETRNLDPIKMYASVSIPIEKDTPYKIEPVNPEADRNRNFYVYVQQWSNDRRTFATAFKSRNIEKLPNQFLLKDLSDKYIKYNVIWDFKNIKDDPIEVKNINTNEVFLNSSNSIEGDTSKKTTVTLKPGEKFVANGVIWTLSNYTELIAWRNINTWIYPSHKHFSIYVNGLSSLNKTKPINPNVGNSYSLKANTQSDGSYETTAGYINNQNTEKIVDLVTTGDSEQTITKWFLYKKYWADTQLFNAQWEEAQKYILKNNEVFAITNNSKNIFRPTLWRRNPSNVKFESILTSKTGTATFNYRAGTADVNYNNPNIKYWDTYIIPLTSHLTEANKVDRLLINKHTTVKFEKSGDRWNNMVFCITVSDNNTKKNICLTNNDIPNKSDINDTVVVGKTIQVPKMNDNGATNVVEVSVYDLYRELYNDGSIPLAIHNFEVTGIIKWYSGGLSNVDINNISINSYTLAAPKISYNVHENVITPNTPAIQSLKLNQYVKDNGTVILNPQTIHFQSDANKNSKWSYDANRGFVEIIDNDKETTGTVESVINGGINYHIQPNKKYFVEFRALGSARNSIEVVGQTTNKKYVHTDFTTRTISGNMKFVSWKGQLDIWNLYKFTFSTKDNENEDIRVKISNTWNDLYLGEVKIYEFSEDKLQPPSQADIVWPYESGANPLMKLVDKKSKLISDNTWKIYHFSLLWAQNATQMKTELAGKINKQGLEEIENRFFSELVWKPSGFQSADYGELGVEYVGDNHIVNGNTYNAPHETSEDGINIGYTNVYSPKETEVIARVWVAWFLAVNNEVVYDSSATRSDQCIGYNPQKHGVDNANIYTKNSAILHSCEVKIKLKKGNNFLKFISVSGYTYPTLWNGLFKSITFNAINEVEGVGIDEVLTTNSQDGVNIAGNSMNHYSSSIHDYIEQSGNGINLGKNNSNIYSAISTIPLNRDHTINKGAKILADKTTTIYSKLKRYNLLVNGREFTSSRIDNQLFRRATVSNDPHNASRKIMVYAKPEEMNSGNFQNKLYIGPNDMLEAKFKLANANGTKAVVVNIFGQAEKLGETKNYIKTYYFIKNSISEGEKQEIINGHDNTKLFNTIEGHIVEKEVISVNKFSDYNDLILSFNKTLTNHNFNNFIAMVIEVAHDNAAIAWKTQYGDVAILKDYALQNSNNIKIVADVDIGNNKNPLQFTIANVLSDTDKNSYSAVIGRNGTDACIYRNGQLLGTCASSEESKFKDWVNKYKFAFVKTNDNIGLIAQYDEANADWNIETKTVEVIRVKDPNPLNIENARLFISSHNDIHKVYNIKALSGDDYESPNTVHMKLLSAGYTGPAAVTVYDSNNNSVTKTIDITSTPDFQDIYVPFNFNRLWHNITDVKVDFLNKSVWEQEVRIKEFNIIKETQSPKQVASNNANDTIGKVILKEGRNVITTFKNNKLFIMWFTLHARKVNSQAFNDNVTLQLYPINADGSINYSQLLVEKSINVDSLDTIAAKQLRFTFPSIPVVKWQRYAIVLSTRNKNGLYLYGSHMNKYIDGYSAVINEVSSAVEGYEFTDNKVVQVGTNGTYWRIMGYRPNQLVDLWNGNKGYAFNMSADEHLTAILGKHTILPSFSIALKFGDMGTFSNGSRFTAYSSKATTIESVTMRWANKTINLVVGSPNCSINTNVSVNSWDSVLIWFNHIHRQISIYVNNVLKSSFTISGDPSRPGIANIASMPNQATLSGFSVWSCYLAPENALVYNNLNSYYLRPKANAEISVMKHLLGSNSNMPANVTLDYFRIFNSYPSTTIEAAAMTKAISKFEVATPHDLYLGIMSKNDDRDTEEERTYDLWEGIVREIDWDLYLDGYDNGNGVKELLLKWNITFRVKGNIYINADKTYVLNDKNKTGDSAISFIWFITDKDIIINSNVEHIEGWFFAKWAIRTIPSEKQLKIKGSVAAQEIDFQNRTYMWKNYDPNNPATHEDSVVLEFDNRIYKRMPPLFYKSDNNAGIDIKEK